MEKPLDDLTMWQQAGIMLGGMLGALGIGRRSKKANGQADVVTAIEKLSVTFTIEQEKVRKAVHEGFAAMTRELAEVKRDQAVLLDRGERGG